MCGICGIFIYKDGVISRDLLISMRDTMVHRGPDGAGCYISPDQKIGLGHRRLSIIDLSPSGSQPMQNEDGTIWIVFNGEIYNFMDLKKELQQMGHSFRSKSDTEVIIHAYEEFGIECVHKLRGMFAFALWDIKEGCIFLVRDRIGIKPLYYTILDNRVLFASEIKAILEDPEVPRSVNELALFHYLTFITTPPPQTLFNGILKIAPGTWLKIDQTGKISEMRYWDVLDHTDIRDQKSEEQTAEMILSALRESVRLRKVSDVPVGIFLSGGLDSSLNAVLFSEGEREKVKTFSIGYEGDYASYRNEFEYSRLVAGHIHSDYHERSLSLDDLFSFIPLLIHHQDEPIGDPVCVPVYYVAQQARENGVIVCQVGEGSDELFWGYPTWQIPLRLEHLNRLWVPSIIKKCLLSVMDKMGYRQSLQFEWLRRSSRKEPVFWGGVDAFTDAEKKRLLSPRLRLKFSSTTTYDAIRPIYERFIKKSRDPSPLNWMSYIDLSLRLPELLLMRVDKMTMAVSVEARVPFLDHKFVEMAISIPERIKTKNRTLKYILKMSARGIIPNEIIDRRKQGFGVPVYEWFSDRLGNEMKKRILAFCDRTDYFDRSVIQEYIERGDAPRLWFLYNFILWHEYWIERRSVDITQHA